MPICLNVESLKPGMRLYQAVCNDYVVLLPPGKVLDQQDVDALRRKYPEMGIMIADPLLDEICDFEDDTADREAARQSGQILSKALGCVRRNFSGRAQMRAEEILGLQQAAAQVMRYLDENPVAAILLERTHSSDTYLQEHSANVFYISMVVGNCIKQYIVEERERLANCSRLERSYAMNLTPLAMGCLLHDVGMLDLQDIYRSVGALTADQRARLAEHPLAGERMLPRTLSAVARMVVRTHHENFNGTGYPGGIPGQRLHIFSRIIRVADAFDAATAPRIYKKAKSELRVLWEMNSGPTREHYDPVVTKVLTGMMNPFPVGAKVRLSNGMYGVVVRQNRAAPFHPQVILAFDRNHVRIPPEQLQKPINLSEHHDLTIVSHAGEDVSYIYTESAVAGGSAEARRGTAEAFTFAYP